LCVPLGSVGRRDFTGVFPASCAAKYYFCFATTQSKTRGNVPPVP
jgi:hypothetical protein